MGQLEEVNGNQEAGIASDEPDPRTPSPPLIPSPSFLSCLTRRQKKGGLLIFSLLYVPLFAGAFFGFGPMQVMLEESGAFHYLCDNSTDTTTTNDSLDQEVCPEQTARLLTIPFVGQCMILTSPILGIIVDRYGPLALMMILAFAGCFGVAMLVAAVEIPANNLLFVAFICIGFMASASSIMTVKTGMVFADEIEVIEEDNAEEEANKDGDNNGTTIPQIADQPDDNENGGDDSKDINDREHKGQSRVISVLNALFDAGSVTYLGLWGISETGPSISAVFVMYLVLAVFCFGGVLVFWLALGDEAFPSSITSTADRIQIEPQSTFDVSKDDADGERRITLDVTGASTAISQKELDDDGRQTLKEEEEDVDYPKTVENDATIPEADHQQSSNQYDAVATNNEDDGVRGPTQQNLSPLPSAIDEYTPVSQRSPKEQLLSMPFIMVLIFFAINVALNQFVLTTTRDFLEYLEEQADDGNEATSEQYLAIFTLLMPASILGLPFTDQVITRFGFHTGFQTVCLLAAVHGIIQVSCDKLNGVQIFGFVVFSFYRCFLFSIVFSYLPTLLSGDVIGKAVGAMHLAAGTATFCNIPLSNFTIKSLDGNFFIPNLVYTILVIPCSLAAWMIGQNIQQEELYKRQNNNKKN